LPPLPGDLAPIVGFPTPETIFVSKTDLASMIVHVTALNDWIRAAAVCLAAGQR
jgi:hypothetical protein